MNNFDFFNTIFKFLQKPSPFLFVISLVTSILIFTSDNLLGKIFILEFRNKFSLYIGIIFLVSTLLILLYFFIWIYSKIKKYFSEQKKYRIQLEYLLYLNKEQLKTVVGMYYREGQCANLDITQSTVYLLERYSIIGRASNMASSGRWFSYYLQPWVVDYIDKHKYFIKDIKTDKIPNEEIIW